MNSGKLSSQAGHGFGNCIAIAAQQNPELLRIYQGPKFIGTKITLVAKTEAHLRKAYEAAQQAGLITSLIEDEHHILPPHFDGSPIITALGIGPCTKEEAHHITKRFECVR